jgi:hypothetical protein
MVNSHFGYTLTHSLVIPEVAFFGTIDAGLNASGSLSVLQGLKPQIKDFGGVNRLHGSLYQLGYGFMGLVLMGFAFVGCMRLQSPRPRSSAE